MARFRLETFNEWRRYMNSSVDKLQKLHIYIYVYENDNLKKEGFSPLIISNYFSVVFSCSVLRYNLFFIISNYFLHIQNDTRKAVKERKVNIAIIRQLLHNYDDTQL